MPLKFLSGSNSTKTPETSLSQVASEYPVTKKLEPLLSILYEKSEEPEPTWYLDQPW